MSVAASHAARCCTSGKLQVVSQNTYVVGGVSARDLLHSTDGVASGSECSCSGIQLRFACCCAGCCWDVGRADLHITRAFIMRTCCCLICSLGVLLGLK